MTAWMLLYIGDLRVQKSEWVVDRKKMLHLMLVWWGLDLGTRLSLPHSCLSLSRLKNVLLNCFVDELSCPLQLKKCMIKVAIENAKLKLLKVLSSYNNALVLSFFTTINPGYMGPLDILRKV